MNRHDKLENTLLSASYGKKLFMIPIIGLNEMFHEKQINYNYNLFIDSNPTKSQIEIKKRKNKNERIMNWTPITMLIGAIAVSHSPYTMEYFESGISAIKLTSMQLELITNNIKPSEDLVDKISMYGGAYFDFAKDIVKRSMEGISQRFIATTVTSYVIMKSIIQSIAIPINMLQEKLDFKNKYISENKIIDLLKEYSGDDEINKYNNFDLFDSALSFNKNYFQNKITKSNLVEKAELMAIKVSSFSKTKSEFIKFGNMSKSIEKNQDFELFKDKILKSDGSISEKDFNQFFPKNKTHERSKILMLLNEEALKAAKQTKLEDETILISKLILNSDKYTIEYKKTFLKELVPIIKEIEGSEEYKNTAKIDSFKIAVKLNNEINNVENFNERDFSKINKRLSSIKTDLIKKDIIYRIPESTYYEKELVTITTKKINDNMLTFFIANNMDKESRKRSETLLSKTNDLFSNSDKLDMSEKKEENKIRKMIQKGNDRFYLIEVDLEKVKKNKNKLN